MPHDMHNSFNHQPVLIGELHASEWLGRLALAIETREPMTAAEIIAQSARVVPGGGVAVIPVQGVIEHKASFWSMYGLGTSTELLGRAFDMAMADEAVSTIVLDVDSPGGTVSGVPEVADKIFKARGSKPIIAAVNAQADSAGYWIASAADEIHITPSGYAGNIGVWTLHYDMSAAMEADGVKPTIVSAGKFKVEGNPFEPLGKEAEMEMQKQVDAIHGMFVSAVARHRDVSTSLVRNDFGQGREMNAKDAKAVGLVDKIQTFEATMSRFAAKPRRRRSVAEVVARFRK